MFTTKEDVHSIAAPKVLIDSEWANVSKTSSSGSEMKAMSNNDMDTRIKDGYYR